MIVFSELDQLRELVDDETLEKVQSTRDYVIRTETNDILMKFRWLDKTPVVLFMQDDHTTLWAANPAVREFATGINGTGKEELFEFLIVMSANDLSHLEELEDRVITLEDQLFDNFDPNKTDFQDLHMLRKEVWRKKRYYEKMELLTDELMQQDDYFTFIDKKFDKLFNYILRTQEYLEHVREAYEAQIDIEQNKLMKFFTVITSIFLPLTLIAGWYGMNLQMPEFQWAHGYPVVIVLSVAIVGFMVYIFKKNKWL
ncbi:MAG: hypothetical protein IJH91_04705 [Mogibacterium sp.]|nr:hypothetical protein [Mogibacterium sp.]